MSDEFIYQTSRKKRFRVFGLVLFGFVAIGLLYYVYRLLGVAFPDILNVQDFIIYHIYNVTELGLFLLGFFGSLFFIPLPIDFLFFKSLSNGANPTIALALVLIGSIIGNIIDYFLGVFLSKYARYLVSVKKLYAAKRWVNRYGAWAIFAFNLTPLPGSLLTFAVGITRYNIYRLFLFFTLGILVKFGAYVLFFSFL